MFKRCLNILVFATILLSLFHCTRERTPRVSKTDKILRGKHKLRRFKVTTETRSQWSGSYFFIVGNASGKSYQERKVAFSWLNNKGEYIISEIPLDKIRVKVDSTVINPYVEFNWESYPNHGDTYMNWIMEDNVNYIVVHCKEEDYPVEIRIDEL